MHHATTGPWPGSEYTGPLARGQAAFSCYLARDKRLERGNKLEVVGYSQVRKGNAIIEHI